MKVNRKLKYVTRTSKYKVKIYSTRNGGMFPIHGAIGTKNGWMIGKWTKEGNWNNHTQPTAYDLLLYEPLDDYVLDTKLTVWNSDEVKFIRYFAGETKQRNLLVFRDGKTSKTCADITSTETFSFYEEAPDGI